LLSKEHDPLVKKNDKGGYCDDCGHYSYYGYRVMWDNGTDPEYSENVCPTCLVGYDEAGWLGENGLTVGGPADDDEADEVTVIEPESVLIDPYEDGYRGFTGLAEYDRWNDWYNK